MNSYLIDDMVKDVRIAIDNNTEDKELLEFADTDTLMLQDIVRAKVVDAANMIVRDAPVDMLYGGVVAELKGMVKLNKVYDTDTMQYAVVRLDRSFMRLVSFRMGDWSMAVTEAISPDSALYAMQRSRIEGVRGNKERPVVAVVPSNVTGGYDLEAYSTKSDNALMTYMPYASLSSDGASIELPVHLYSAIVYATAYLTALAFGAGEQAANLLRVAHELAHISDAAPDYVQQPQQPLQQEEQ